MDKKISSWHGSEGDDLEPFLTSNGNHTSNTIEMHRHQRERKNHNNTESHQFENDESDVWRIHQLQRYTKDKGHWWTHSRRTEVRRWVLTLVTGAICGVVAMFVTSLTTSITHSKLNLFNSYIDQEKNGSARAGTAYVVLVLCNLVLVSIAWLMARIEPIAAGSGIAEIKCYLNGLNIPHVARMKTLVCKVVGIIFSCASGLPFGKEGPMVHAGAVIAAAVSQGRTWTCGINTSFSKHQDFRNDREKRDFVACGAASGVAAAFAAPVGGVLFSLEEGASYWSTKLTWRCFFCAMTTVFTLLILKTAKTYFGHSNNTAMFSFGEFFSLQDEESNYAVWELLLFAILGGMGGVMGAVFNGVQNPLYRYRRNHSAGRQLFEVLVITLAMTTIAYGMPALWSKCTPLPITDETWSEQEKNLMNKLVPLYCDSSTQYNELASLYLVDSDTAIKQLFHFREVGDRVDNTFSSSALLIFLAPYMTVASISFGCGVPGGLFVPSLISGAAFGRLVGHLLHKMDKTRGTFADSGTYALMGSAAVTGGVTRMTISLTVIILEATGDMQYVLPLMLVLMIARFVGNIFNEGIYDIHIHSRKFKFLDEDDGTTHIESRYDISVTDIMTRNPVCFHRVMRVGAVFDTLKRCTHNSFPVEDERDGNVFCGSISRKVLTTLLEHKAYSNDETALYSKSPVISWGMIEHVYPRYPQIEDLELPDSVRDYWINITPYIDTTAYTLQDNASVQRAYRMFRTLGLRHLFITNRHNRIVGIVTRAELVASHIDGCQQHGQRHGLLAQYDMTNRDDISDDDL